MVRWWRANQAKSGVGIASAPILHWPRTITFRNDASETAPAYGVLAITGCELADNKMAILHAEKPTTPAAKIYAINADRDVPRSTTGSPQYGQCFLFGDVRVLFDTGSPALGEIYGPKSGQWTATKTSPDASLVRSIGTLDASGMVMQAEYLSSGDKPRIILGYSTADYDTTDGTITVDGVSVLQDKGTTATGISESGTLDVSNLFAWKIDNNGKVIAVLNENATDVPYYIAIQADCSTR